MESTPSILNTGSSGVVFEGIKEGVQGVSRILAAGLSMADYQQPASLPASLASHFQARSSMSMHSANSSNSSISTTTTFASRSTNARFSQSSFSSIGEEIVASTSAESSTTMDVSLVARSNSIFDEIPPSPRGMILMVRDSGTIPIMVPNPDFILVAHICQQRQQARRKEQEEQQQQQQERQRLAHIDISSLDKDSAGRGSVSTSRSSSPVPSSNLRRRSRDVSNFDLSNVGQGPRLHSLQEGHKSKNSGGTHSDLLPPLQEESTADKAKRVKRASLNSTFPPMASIPGLGSLTSVATAPVVSSWVGSMGKRLEELQKISGTKK